MPSYRPLAVPLGLVTFLGWTPGAAQAPAPPPVLSLPIDCRLGQDCFVQQYFDHDPGPGEKDYRCGGRVYDGHDGLDIRVPSIAAQQRGVAVLAAADGLVTGTRDGESDHAAGSVVDRATISGRECGNGVVITHAGGWQTQYCHMAKGSIAVARGQRVKAGDRLGLVGLSGDTQFPHLHLSVRQGSRKVDPFAPDVPPSTCGASAASMMWSPQAASALAYRETEIVNAGFASGPVSMEAIETEALSRPNSAAPAAVFFARAIGLQAGDQVLVRFLDPGGKVLAENVMTIDRAKAQWMAMAGRKRPPAGWAPGRYRGTFTVRRGGRTVVERSLDLRL